MSELTLCDRTSGSASRTRIKDVDFKSNVSDFRAKTSQLINLPEKEIELVYCGECLRDNRTLESYVSNQSFITIHALKKHVDEQEQCEPEPMDSGSIQQVVTALQAALINPAHRNAVENMMTRPETIENLVAATPGLERDPVALAMLQDAELLAILADPDNIFKVIEAHPCLGHAAMMVAAAINEESSKPGNRTTSGSSRANYSLDQMSDDEDMVADPPMLRQSAQPITTSQLAAALAMSGGNSQPTTSAASSSSSAAAGSRITAEFFQQAMLQASGGAAGDPPSSSSSSGESDTALQQLKDMGITDEARARQALQITGGNIQAALELLFGDEL